MPTPRKSAHPAGLLLLVAALHAPASRVLAQAPPRTVSADSAARAIPLDTVGLPERVRAVLEPAADARRITLEEAVGYALSNSPRLRGERLRVAVTETENDLALSAWRPQLTILGDGLHYFRQPVSVVPDFNNPESGETRVVAFGARNTTSLGAVARQLVFSPEVIRDRRLREPLVESAALAVAEVARDLKADVSTAFLETLRTREQLTLALQDIDRLERSLRDALLRSSEGLDSKVPRLRAQIALNDARARAEAAAERLGSRRARLRQLLGYGEGDATLALDYDYDRIEVLASTPERPRLLPERRAEIQKLNADRRAQELRIEYARNSWLPNFGVSAGYDLDWQDNRVDALFGRTFRSSYAAFDVSLPLYRGGARGHETELALLRDAQLARETEATTLRIETEYAIADNDLDAALARLDASRANRELAREVYETVRLQFREGITRYLDVVIAENDLQNARAATLDATIDAAVARVELERAAGTL